jgi:hypothetical protein
MADIEIIQADADALMQMEKCCVEEKEWLFPIPGDRLAIPLTSVDKRENFMLDAAPRSNLRKRLTRTARGRRSYSCGSISTGRRTGIWTEKKFRALTCIFIERVSATNRPLRLRSTGTRIRSISF